MTNDNFCSSQELTELLQKTLKVTGFTGEVRFSVLTFMFILYLINKQPHTYTSDCLLCILIVLSQFTNMLPSILEEGDIDFQVRRTHLNTLKVKIVIFYDQSLQDDV